MNENVNSSAGYVCGVICSDGKVVWDEKHSNYAISLETKNRELADMFYRNMTKIIEKEPSVGTHRRIVGGREVHMDIVTVYGRKIVEGFVNRWGLRHGRRSWYVPRLCWDDIDFRHGFLMGFFDGSASVSSVIRQTAKKKVKERSLRLYSINQPGLAGLRDLLLFEGIKCIMYPAGDCYTIKISGKTRMRSFADKIGFGLTSKKSLLEEALLPLTLSASEDIV